MPRGGGAEQIAQSAQPLRRGLAVVVFQGVEQRRCVLRLGGVLAQRVQQQRQSGANGGLDLLAAGA